MKCSRRYKGSSKGFNIEYSDLIPSDQVNSFEGTHNYTYI